MFRKRLTLIRVVGPAIKPVSYVRIYTSVNDWTASVAVDDSSVNTMFLRRGGSLIKASARSMMYDDAEEEHSDTAGRSARDCFSAVLSRTSRAYVD